MALLMRRMYFDNAATSFPKPPGVAAAVATYLQDEGAPAGRGAYRQALEIERRVGECRQWLAELFHLPRSRQVIFTFNGTDSLNLAILGLCRLGDHVVTSNWEHNSVLRPLRHLQTERGVDVTWLEPDAQGLLTAAQVAAALRDNTRLVALQHANNVIGVIQPIAEIGTAVRQHGAYFLVDAAQSAGHLPLDVSELAIDLLAASGHKGLLGPLGVGVLGLSDRVVDDLAPLRFGGTGTLSEDDRQPHGLPEKFESGNLNVPGIVGLHAALHWRRQQDHATLWQTEQQLLQRLWTGLSTIPGVTLFGADPQTVPRIGVISLQLSTLDPQDAAAVLDDHFGIQVRAGLHCAPGVHRTLGTLATGGTLRLSIGPFVTPDDIDAAIEAIATLSGA